MSDSVSWGYAASVALTGWNPAFSMFIQIPIIIIVTLIMLFYFELSFGKSVLAGYLVQIPIALFISKVGFDFFLSYMGFSGSDASVGDVPEATPATATPMPEQEPTDLNTAEGKKVV